MFSIGRHLRSVLVMAGDIKIAHSIFALPFAILGAFMAGRPEGVEIDWGQFGAQLGLIGAAMVCARTAAMLANRLIDRELDGLNPRTAGRALPSGRVSYGAVWLGLVISGGAFLGVCWGFYKFFGNGWPLVLGLPVLVWICAYGWLKRFTWGCHLYLGLSLALSPLAAAVAVDPQQVVSQPGIWLLSGMVWGWVAGFDIIYALQDEEVDSAQGLHSIPARFGSYGARWFSRGLHGGAMGMLIMVWVVDDRLGVWFGMGVVSVVGLLIYEHATLVRWGTSKMALTFFMVNGVISMVLGGLGVIDISW